MNSTNSSSNFTYTYYTAEDVLNMFGSTLLLDVLNFYPYLVLSVIGLFLSILTLVALFSPGFDMNFYKYLKVYTVNNIVNSFINLSNFLAGTTYHILPWTNSKLAIDYYVYGITCTLNICYFYGGVINIVIALDRITFFKRHSILSFHRTNYLLLSW